MILLEGAGLHGGAPSSVALTRSRGPSRLASGGDSAPWGELRVVDTARSTTVALGAGEARVRTVEHLFAALGALGAESGLSVDVRGAEVPLLDGGAARFCEALRSLGLPAASPRPGLRVMRDAVVSWQGTEWTLRRADAVRVSVHFETSLRHVDHHAQWEGDRDDFVARIAPARTFAMVEDLEALARGGLARAAPPDAVVVYGREGALYAGVAPAPDEAARHKLLDLVGDLTVRGGLVLGDVSVRRPGHGSTHAVVDHCLREAILAPL